MFLVTVLLAASWLPFHHHKPKSTPNTKWPEIESVTIAPLYANGDLLSASKWNDVMPAFHEKYDPAVPQEYFTALESDIDSILYGPLPESAETHERFAKDVAAINAEMDWADTHSRI